MKTTPDILTALGGPSAVAHALNLGVTTVGQWKARGAIPDRYRNAILILAKRTKVRLDHAAISRAACQRYFKK